MQPETIETNENFKPSKEESTEPQKQIEEIEAPSLSDKDVTIFKYPVLSLLVILIAILFIVVMALLGGN
jgi:hypothetical protein